MSVRKTATVLFSDIADSTSLGERLDVESLRRVIGSYFEEVRTVVERHGGTLEKFIGDAVVALFGVPVAREDDALRALRAAAEIRERVELLNEGFDRELGVRLAVRTGINTGEVLVEDGSAETFNATGDTLNVAARLEQAAPAGEILIAAATRALGGDAIVVEPLERLSLKGKSEPVEAFRLVQVLPHASSYGRRDDAPLVGRRHELALLHGALSRAERGAQCELATIVGSAGVGKSRLAREFLASLDESVRLLLGRCVPYGEGVTYRPLAEAFEPLLRPDPRSRVLELLAGEPRAELVAENVAAALGAAGATASAEETFWAFRRLLETVARERALVLLVDDIHWAEPTLLDLLEYVGSFSGGAPLVLLCLARPDLLEQRPTWATPRENASVVVLSPLADDESHALVEHLSQGLPEEERRRVVEAADGNPLFLEQLLALNTGRGAGEDLVVPPTIQALLTARLDQLDAADRTVLECASIQGRMFDRETLVALLPAEQRPDVGGHLLSLARRQFVRPLRREDAGTDSFAFSHALVRDAAYGSLPKETRAALHVRLAEHLEQTPGSGGELVGHHLAEAVTYRRELGRQDETTRAIAERGAELLAEGGRRAYGLGDDRAAATLLERACETLPDGSPEIWRLRLELARALFSADRLGDARELFLAVQAAAREAGDTALEQSAVLGALGLRARYDPAAVMGELVAASEHASSVLEAVGDEEALAFSSFLVHWAHFRRGRVSESLAAAERAAEHADRAGHRREMLRALGGAAMALIWGPTPVVEALRRCDELVARADGALLVEAFAERVRGGLASMTGDFDAGRERCRRSIEIYEELGQRISAIGVASERQRIERQSGRLDAAERTLRSAYAELQEIGDVGYTSWMAAELARVLAEQGQSDEALELARRCREELQRDHAFAQVAARLAEATVFRTRGAFADAESRAREALELVEATDILDLHGDVLFFLSELDLEAGRAESARASRAAALGLYQRKGDVVSAARVRAAAH